MPQGEEKVAVVTGSSGGIGYETSLMLARNGFHTKKHVVFRLSTYDTKKSYNSSYSALLMPISDSNSNGTSTSNK